MIEIVTLLLGLVTGPVELEMQAVAAQVEVRLDGRVVETLTSAPWRLEIDLGDALVPHELVAVARDETGRELARARRWINIDLPQAAIGGRSPPGGLTPLPVVFAAGTTPSPEEMASWFREEGTALSVSAVDTGPAEVVIVQDPATRRDLQQLAQVYLIAQLNRLGFPAESPLEESAAESAASFLHLPKEEFREAARSFFSGSRGAPESKQVGLLWEAYNDFASLGDETEVRFISPLAAPVSRTEELRNLFLQSAAVSDVGLLWLAHNQRPMSFAYRFADAVAIAGREAHAGGRRRAVVLLLGEQPTDDSRFAADAVREYLRSLRVPLVVWSLSGGGELAGFETDRLIGLPSALEGRSVRSPTVRKTFEWLAAAAAELRRLLESQSIVWLAGEHLPHRIELAAEARGARPAGIGPPAGDASAEREHKYASGAR